MNDTDPHLGLVPSTSLTRRRFLLGSSLVALGAEACSKPPRDDLIPYVQRPRDVIPGAATFYATTATRDAYGFGLLVESHEGRPTKIEGHPEHPASLGATGPREQAAIYSLYDPERAKAVRRRGAASSWSAFEFAMRAKESAPWSARGGEGLAVLLEPSTSLVAEARLDALRERFPEARVHFHAERSAIDRLEGARLAFGEPFDAVYSLDGADVVLSLDADLSGGGAMAVPMARAFFAKRRVESPRDGLPRLYAVETALGLTGAAADHRLAVPPGELPRVARSIANAILAALGDRTSPLAAALAAEASRESEPAFVRAAARDLVQARGRAVVLVGDRQPPDVHALGHALNALLGAFDHVVRVTRSPILEAGAPSHDVRPLLAALDAGAIDTLCVLGSNPGYSLPGDARVRERFGRAREVIHLGEHADETSALASWQLPAAHFLEAWGDARAMDGTSSVVQPLVVPLWGGRTVAEVLAALHGAAVRDSRRLLRDVFERRNVDFEDAVARGVVPHTDTLRPRAPSVDLAAVAAGLVARPSSPPTVTLAVAPHPVLHDGDLANNAWLQEMPEPVTKLVWGHALLVGPSTAASLGVRDGDAVEVASGERAVRLAAFVQPGHAEGAVTAWLGHGRRAPSLAASAGGADLAALRRLDAPWIVEPVTVRKIAGKERVIVTQTSADQHGRVAALRSTLDAWRADPAAFRQANEDPASILPERLSGSPQWGMAIDLAACTGCSACVVACQAENNVPVVGPADSALFRTMHWLRIDRYYGGTPAEPEVDLQPMLCQHCEKAPCEYVCPVNATVHSPDGLNEMVYNRCVGTRYCSNNCPYKVRRFNFYSHDDDLPESLRMAMNPGVTVRARGVMEKCTYCVQRIRRTEIDARVARRALRDGEIRTACEQVCPTEAIVFGDVSDPRSRVSELHRSPRAYAALGDVGTRPRTRYLARITNPGPEPSR
ncbi:MAG TPA: 4Fe-4S dicluster domain-containing protein [Polyangiaceae bacterium]|nr:4Fe-4S dicluster domain-containing protein [Polyangiaceae bacterium]